VRVDCDDRICVKARKNGGIEMIESRFRAASKLGGIPGGLAKGGR
jgi:hypothetical protein